MAFQAVVDTVEIDLIFTENGETLQNVFYAKLPGGYLLADLVALAVAVDGAMASHFLPQQVIECFYARTEIRGLAVQNDLTTTNNTSAGVGILAGGALPNNVTLAVKKESGLTGRSARGRCYWIGAVATALDAANENKFTVAYTASIVAAVDRIRVVVPTVGLWEAVLVSRFTGGLPRAFGLTFPWVSSVAVNEVVDSQRGRLPA